MNTYSIAVKSSHRISGDQSNFAIKFDQFLPYDKTVFKCKVSAIISETINLELVTNIDAAASPALVLTADFPFINY